ncbi:hypothetical protein VTJ04DRAFT_7446 [Mycothermus thermophilus]|uniref:uncharacterized protein n=1 Tax=Humicola insolens TaxID=85995 RepID=UPI003743A263
MRRQGFKDLQPNVQHDIMLGYLKFAPSSLPHHTCRHHKLIILIMSHPPYSTVPSLHHPNPPPPNLDHSQPPPLLTNFHHHLDPSYVDITQRGSRLPAYAQNTSREKFSRLDQVIENREPKKITRKATLK